MVVIVYIIVTAKFYVTYQGQEITCKFCGQIDHKQAACPQKKEFSEFASSLKNTVNLATELAMSISKNN